MILIAINDISKMQTIHLILIEHNIVSIRFIGLQNRKGGLWFYFEIYEEYASSAITLVMDFGEGWILVAGPSPREWPLVACV